jgi:rhamnosyl/mannosyltransferase
LKVIHIFKTYVPDTQGGLEETIRQISRYTTSKGVNNRIITVSDNPNPSRIIFNEAEVIRYKKSLDIFSTPISIKFFNNYTKHFAKSDILHFHFPWPFAELLYLIKQVQKPSIVTYHADAMKNRILKSFYKPVINQFLKKVKRIIVTSSYFLDSSVDLRPFKGKCDVINLSIDLHRFGIKIDELTDDSAIIKAVKKKYGKDFFLFVGVLRHYKGIEYLLEAMQGIDKKLVIIGRGDKKQELENKAKALGLNNVFFTGYVDDRFLPAFYKLSRAFVFPSINRSEAFGVSLLEASMFSKPMITTELSTGTSYVNQHLKTGFVIPSKDVMSLRKTMITLSEDDSLCSEFGKNARKRYEEKFTNEIAGRKYMQIYNDILGA